MNWKVVPSIPSPNISFISVPIQCTLLKIKLLHDAIEPFCLNGSIRTFKGDLLCKNHFYKVFEHSCVAAVCENNQPIMLKIHQLIFFIKPINHKQTVSPNKLFQILPLFTSLRGKSPAHL